MRQDGVQMLKGSFTVIQVCLNASIYVESYPSLQSWPLQEGHTLGNLSFK